MCCGLARPDVMVQDTASEFKQRGRFLRSTADLTMCVHSCLWLSLAMASTLDLFEVEAGKGYCDLTA